MPLPVIAGVVRCAYRGLAPSGRQWTNVIHARFSGGASSPGTTDIVALDAILVRLYTGTAFTSGAAWLTNCHSNVTLIDMTAYVLNGTSVAQIVNHAAGGSNASGASLPSEVAHVLTLRTAVRGRSRRGRIYLPPVNSTVIDTAGNIVASAATTTIAQANGIVTALGGASVAPFWELGVASYLGVGHFEPISSFTMDLKPDVQRRRK